MADDDERLRAGLAPLWPAPEPSADFAARLLARLGSPPASATDPAPAPASAAASGSRWSRRAAGVVALAVVAAVAVIAVVIGVRRGAPLVEAGPAQGTVAATEVATVRMGRRAVVVAHPGAVIAWSIAADGSADVHQTGGEAFYRVERGGRFDVHTPGGVVRVVGTCFTVTIANGLTTVDVQEGAVELRDDAEIVALRPGERGHLGGDAPARRRPATAAAASPPHTAARPAAPASAPRGDQCYCLSDPRYLEADQVLLDEWAAQCRVRADVPPLVDEHDTSAIDQAAGMLGLAGDERRAFAAAAEETSRTALARVREIYTAATGDAAGTLAIEDLLEQIDATRTLGEDARVRAALASERAGHAPPVVDPARMTPYEEFYRLFVAAGDDFERRLGERLGAPRARELRLRFGGWPGPDFDWIGCPQR